MIAQAASAFALVLALGACVAPVPMPAPVPAAEGDTRAAALRETPLPPGAAEAFVAVVARVEPVAESLCRAHARAAACDFTIAVDDRPGQPANAFQTLDRRGRPYIVFTTALIAEARNADELAFVMGHEAAHHIAGHIPRRADQALEGAMLAGVLATVAGASPDEVETAQAIGADLAARQYSKDFELEADALGTEIAWLAGFDPVAGAAFFARLPDPGDKFLGSHPPNAQRRAVVASTLAALKAR